MSATSTFTYRSPIARFLPPPVLSSAARAPSAVSYNGAGIVDQSLVSSFHCLTVNVAPELGAVVCIQIDPVGLGFESVDLYSGTDVCGASVTNGA